MNICIYGAGAWGTALAVSAARHHHVTLYGRDASHVAALEQVRSNQRYLAGVPFPDALRVTSSIEMAFADTELLVIATPVAGLREACITSSSHLDQPPVWLCKGFEEGTALLPHEVVGQAVQKQNGASLSGPSFALEVANALPTALTVASSNAALRERVINAFHHDTLRVYSSEDLVGVEVGGALEKCSCHCDRHL